jgi:hypothetical protein
MNQVALIILGGIALLIVVVVLWALNRSWGHFPERTDVLPPVGSSAPGMSSQPASRSYSPAIGQAPGDQAGEPPVGLVPIEHPMVRRAAKAALEKDSRAARYIVRDGDQLYFSFDQIGDPTERQAAYDLMRRFNAGEDVDIQAMMQLTRRMFE